MSNHYCKARKQKNNGAIKGYKEKSDWGEMRRKDGELPMGCDSFWTMAMGICQKNMQQSSPGPNATGFGVLFVYIVSLGPSVRSKSTTATTFLWRPVKKGY